MQLKAQDCIQTSFNQDQETSFLLLVSNFHELAGLHEHTHTTAVVHEGPAARMPKR